MNKKISIARGDSVVVHALLKKPEADVAVRGAPLVVFVHGFPKIAGDAHKLFEQAGNMLQASGFANITFDYAECDEDDFDPHALTFDSIQQDFEAIFQWARNNHYSRLAFIAEGLGAAFVYKLMPAQTALNILCWPALHIDHVLETHKSLDLNDESAFPFGPSLNSSLENFNLKPLLREPGSPPVLILHGEDDTVFPADIHLEYARKHLMSRRIDITTFEQGTHGLTEGAHQAACLQHILNFISSHQEETKADKKARLERAMKILEN